MSKKIAIIGVRGYPSDFPGSSGIDTYIGHLLPFFNKNNLTIYTRSWVKKSKSTYKVKAIFCLKNKYLDTGIYSILSTIKALNDKNDIFWFQAPGSCLLIWILKIFNKESILTVHGLDWQRKKWNNPLNKFLLQQLESLAVNSSTYCTGVSLEICKYIKTKYNKDCYLTPPSPTSNPKIKANIIKNKYNISKNSYLLYLGRLVPEKRIDWLISAYLQNKKINQKYKLIIAGNIENNKYCKQLISHASKNIIFTNYVSGQSKDELISNCSVFIQPSELEGNSISIQEAISFNKKCLLSNINIHKELLKKYKNIVTFKRTYQSFDKNINKILNSPIQKQEIKNNWKNTANIFLNLFNL